MPKSDDDLLSTNEVAALLNRSVRQIRRQALIGIIPAKKLGPGTAGYVFKRSDIEPLLAAATEQAAS